ncbi:DUF4160 domain-containing protein [Micrococcus luteus]|uniref:DUF4160 domain-containing protein n=1 Tax=Micrococcus luteus TaxID=1270 RepID=UPI001C2262AF|nr:DUF4160 domain-containing protein [Micrococcus luteus]MBU8650082.1 DUF4160 domain-containing protein [Micrococcus luteus]
MTNYSKQIFTRRDWEDAIREGWIDASHMEARLYRVAVREFGDQECSGYDEEGFFLSLVADGLNKEGIGHFQIYSNDHDPPHVHVVPSGHKGDVELRFSLTDGRLLDKRPKSISSKSIKRIQAVILELQDQFDEWWEKKNYTPDGTDQGQERNAINS